MSKHQKGIYTNNNGMKVQIPYGDIDGSKFYIID